MSAEVDFRVQALAELIRESARVVALTGAGISVPSGIPDFRSPGTGLWANVDPMEVAHIDVFQRDPERFWQFYGQRFQTLEHKRPNGAHEALAELERGGMLDAVITQNIDRLHERAGSRSLVEVHGSIAHSFCPRCALRYAIAEVRERQDVDARGVPRCECGSALKPDVVLFGELLNPDALAAAQRWATSADLMLCIGSSLEVYPVGQLPLLTLAAGGRIAILTEGPTPLDESATVRLSGDVVDDLRAILAAVAPVLGGSGSQAPPRRFTHWPPRARAAQPRPGRE
ncbi:MAG: SIR2 family NAD-dependent protein deacylase [Solirubrobacteraceae bacterium]